MAKHKTCTKCLKSMPASEDHFRARKNTRHKDGLNSQCRQCESEYTKTRYRANSERIKKERRERHNAIKDDNEYKSENSRRARAYYWNNRKLCLEKSKVRSKKWNEENREKRNEITRRYVARKLAAAVEQADYGAIIKRDRNICYLCAEIIEGDFHFDHIIALSRGGSHSSRNIGQTHPACNWSKGSKSVEELSPDVQARLYDKLRQLNDTM